MSITSVEVIKNFEPEGILPYRRLRHSCAFLFLGLRSFADGAVAPWVYCNIPLPGNIAYLEIWNANLTVPNVSPTSISSSKKPKFVFLNFKWILLWCVFFCSFHSIGKSFIVVLLYSHARRKKHSHSKHINIVFVIIAQFKNGRIIWCFFLNKVICIQMFGIYTRLSEF